MKNILVHGTVRSCQQHLGFSDKYLYSFASCKERVAVHVYIFYFHIRLSILMCITRFILAHQNPSTNNYPQVLYIVGLFFSSVLSDLFRFAAFFGDSHQQGLKLRTRKPCSFLQDDDFHYNVSDHFSVGVDSTTN